MLCEMFPGCVEVTGRAGGGAGGWRLGVRGGLLDVWLFIWSAAGREHSPRWVNRLKSLLYTMGPVLHQECDSYQDYLTGISLSLLLSFSLALLSLLFSNTPLPLSLSPALSLSVSLSRSPPLRSVCLSLSLPLLSGCKMHITHIQTRSWLYLLFGWRNNTVFSVGRLRQARRLVSDRCSITRGI